LCTPPERLIGRAVAAASSSSRHATPGGINKDSHWTQPVETYLPLHREDLPQVGPRVPERAPMALLGNRGFIRVHLDGYLFHR